MLSSRTRTGGPSSATIRRVALDPVELGHPHVHQHDVGAQPLGLGDAGRAVGRLADDLEIGHGLERHPQAGADELEVVDEQDADAHGTLAVARSQRQPRRDLPAAAGGGPRRDLAAVDAQPLAHADQAVPAARELRARAAVAAVGHVHGERVVAPASRTCVVAPPACLIALVSASCTTR